MKYNRLRNDVVHEGWVLWMREHRPEGEIEIDTRFIEKEKKVSEEVEEIVEEVVEEGKSILVEEETVEEEEVLTHVVQAGETLYQIHKKYDVSVEDIKKWNSKTDNTLSVGEKLIIKK